MGRKTSASPTVFNELLSAISHPGSKLGGPRAASPPKPGDQNCSVTALDPALQIPAPATPTEHKTNLEMVTGVKSYHLQRGNRSFRLLVGWILCWKLGWTFQAGILAQVTPIPRASPEKMCTTSAPAQSLSFADLGRSTFKTAGCRRSRSFYSPELP